MERGIFHTVGRAGWAQVREVCWSHAACWGPAGVYSFFPWTNHDWLAFHNPYLTSMKSVSVGRGRIFSPKVSNCSKKIEVSTRGVLMWSQAAILAGSFCDSKLWFGSGRGVLPLLKYTRKSCFDSAPGCRASQGLGTKEWLMFLN